MKNSIDGMMVAALASLDDSETNELLVRVNDLKNRLGTQLKLAVEHGDASLVHALIDHGAALPPGTPFDLGVIVANNNDVKMLSVLLSDLLAKREGSYGAFAAGALQHAAEVDAVDVLRTILAHAEQADKEGAVLSSAWASNPYFFSINGMTEFAAEHGSARVVSFLLSHWESVREYDHGARLITASIKSGNNDVLASVLAAGVPDRSGAFQAGAVLAARNGNVDALRMLLDAGLVVGAPARVESKSVVGSQEQFDWNTLLSAVTRDGARGMTREIVELALSRGGEDVAIGEKVFYWSVLSGASVGIDALAERGFDIAVLTANSRARVDLNKSGAVVEALFRGNLDTGASFRRAVGERIFVDNFKHAQPLLEALDERGVVLDAADIGFACGRVCKSGELAVLSWLESRGVDIAKHATMALNAVTSNDLTSGAIEAPVAEFWLDRGAKLPRAYVESLDYALNDDVKDVFLRHDRGSSQIQFRDAPSPR